MASKNRLPRAVGYVRTSDEVTFEDQRQRIIERCASQGWSLGGIYAYEDVRSDRWRRRLERFVSGAQAVGTTVLVTPGLDLLAGSAVDLLWLVDRLETVEVALVAVDDGIDTSAPPTAHVVRAVLEAAAGFEQARTPTGAPVQIAPEVEERIVELRQEGLTLRAISARLDADGVATVRGGPWNPASVAVVLKRHGSAR